MSCHCSLHCTCFTQAAVLVITGFTSNGRGFLGFSTRRLSSGTTGIRVRRLCEKLKEPSQRAAFMEMQSTIHCMIFDLEMVCTIKGSKSSTCIVCVVFEYVDKNQKDTLYVPRNCKNKKKT